MFSSLLKTLCIVLAAFHHTKDVASTPLRLPLDVEGVKDVVTGLEPHLTSLGFVFSTYAPTATVSVLTTETHLEVSISTPTPTVYIIPTDLSIVTTTLGELEGTVTATSTILEAGPSITPIPPPAPSVSVCAPWFYLNNATLLWLQKRSVTAYTPFFSQIQCNPAIITSKLQAQAIGVQLCENVFISDGLNHTAPGFVPYQCPILAPNGIVKQPQGANVCGSAKFDTLCVLKLT